MVKRNVKQKDTRQNQKPIIGSRNKEVMTKKIALFPEVLRLGGHGNVRKRNAYVYV